MPKLNVVPTTNFFPASQAWASSAHSRSKQLCKCPLVQRCRRDVRACIATMARLKSYPPTSWPGHLSVQFCNGYSAAIARSSTNPSPHPFSWGRAFRIRSTGISVVPCPRGATLGSRSPAAGASRSFGLAQFSGTRNARQFKAGERGLQHPTRLAGNGLRAGGLCNRARPEHRHR